MAKRRRTGPQHGSQSSVVSPDLLVPALATPVPVLPWPTARGMEAASDSTCIPTQPPRELARVRDAVVGRHAGEHSITTSADSACIPTQPPKELARVRDNHRHAGEHGSTTVAAPHPASTDSTGTAWPDGCGCEHITEDVWDNRLAAQVLAAYGIRSAHMTKHAHTHTRIATRCVCVRRIRVTPAHRDRHDQTHAGDVHVLHPAAGQFGLYTTEPLPQGTWLCNYTGFVTDAAHCSTASNYLVAMGGLTIDASAVGNEARFINDYRGIARAPNVELRIDYRTPIEDDDECGREVMTPAMPTADDDVCRREVITPAAGGGIHSRDRGGVGANTAVALPTACVTSSRPPRMGVWTADEPIPANTELLLDYGQGFWKQ